MTPVFARAKVETRGLLRIVPSRDERDDRLSMKVRTFRVVRMVQSEDSASSRYVSQKKKWTEVVTKSDAHIICVHGVEGVTVCSHRLSDDDDDDIGKARV